MRIGVIGSGYVGLVAGTCFAEMGNDVVVADIDSARIEDLRRNQIPIYEPELATLVSQNQASGRLEFTTDIGQAVAAPRVVFIAVGTPPQTDGAVDVSAVLSVAETIGDHTSDMKVVVIKSTVPVGTAARVREVIAARTASPFHVCSNPEFMKEGAAIQDFMRPDRVIIGAEAAEAEQVLREIYEPLLRTDKPLIVMDTASAELTKYAANAMLATRISFMNQIAALCESVGADVDLVRQGLGSDSRIGPAFLFPSPGYGGSCLPKDLRALIQTGVEQDVSLDLFEAVNSVNERQKQRLAEKLVGELDGQIGGSTIAVWGLAFKAQTDDMRGSPAIDVIESLLEMGATVRAHDPEARLQAERLFGSRITYCDRSYDALEGADALVVVTEWPEYRNPDFARMRGLMKRPLVVDGRNLYDHERMRAIGFDYLSIGREAS